MNLLDLKLNAIIKGKSMDSSTQSNFWRTMIDTGWEWINRLCLVLFPRWIGDSKMIRGLFQIALRNWNSTLIMDAMLGHLYLATEDPKIGPLPICTSRTEKSSSMKRVCRFLREPPPEKRHGSRGSHHWMTKRIPIKYQRRKAGVGAKPHLQRKTCSLRPHTLVA